MKVNHITFYINIDVGIVFQYSLPQCIGNSNHSLLIFPRVLQSHYMQITIQSSRTTTKKINIGIGVDVDVDVDDDRRGEQNG